MSRQGRVAGLPGAARSARGHIGAAALLYGAAAVSGLLYGAAVPPSPWSALGWIALAPLLWALADARPGRGFGLGFTFGLVAFAVGISWIRTFGIPAWGLVSSYLALYAGAFGALAAYLARRRAAWLPWGAAAAWAGIELLRSTGPTAFPWALLGHTQWNGPLLGVAAYAGVVGISFALALAAGVLAMVARAPTDAAVPGSAALAAAVVAGALLLGRVALASPFGPALRAAALQPNVPVDQKFDAAFARANLDLLRSQTREAAGRGAVLVSWPESAAGFASLVSGPVAEEAAAMARASRVVLVASAIDPARTNSAAVFNPDGRFLGRYDKVRLVAFGEAGTVPGREHAVYATRAGGVGIGVCFESIFPEISRGLARRGAAVLVIITNDGWSAGTDGPEQHAVISVFRAVETGRPVVRAANIGVSMLIDGHGRIVAEAGQDRRVVLVGDVAGTIAPTPYVRVGDLLGWLALAASVGGAVWIGRDRLRDTLRTRAFRKVAVACGVPLVAVLGAAGFGAAGRAVAVAAALAAIGALTGWRTWGWRLRAFPPALALAGGTVAALALVVLAGFRSKGIPVDLSPPPGGWVVGTAWLVGLVGLPMELWLRGAAYDAIDRWQGWVAALGVTTALGLLPEWTASPERLGWALVTGAAFGLVRARFPNLMALAVAHGVGLALAGFVLR